MPQPPIPDAPQWPVVGSVPAIGFRKPVQALVGLAGELGPIFRMHFPHVTPWIVSSQALAEELADESRFEKAMHGPLRQLREVVGDGLFTAESHEPNWGKAHRILMPAFGPAAMPMHFDAMQEVAEQMLTKWARQGPETVHEVADEMTRLTLDTIALCAFGYRFNSFYREAHHPFVSAMVRSLDRAGVRSKRPAWANRLWRAGEAQAEADLRLMRELTAELIAKRRALPPEEAPEDLLALMLAAKDPETGEALDAENVQHQMITFLVAGHETTSGMLSFALHELLAHPEALAKAQGIVDEVLGHEAPRFEHLARLGHLECVLKETLRLHPTAPGFALRAKVDTSLGGHPMPAGQHAFMLLPALHRDPAVWESPDEFRPERFEPEAYAKLPPHAWMPFGTGARACIGRAFAMQEAVLLLAMLLQRFTIRRPEAYALQVKESLTWKPEGLRLLATPRPGWGPAQLAQRAQGPVARPKAPAPQGPAPAAPGPQDELLVLFGSNAGSAKAFAKRLAEGAEARGERVRLASLDEGLDAVGQAQRLLVVCASYNGKPPVNARRFLPWLQAQEAGSLKGLRFALFGCGHHDWPQTYQEVPKALEAGLLQAGASPLLPRGEGDAGGAFFEAFEAWSVALWPLLAPSEPSAPPAAGGGCPYHRILAS